VLRVTARTPRPLALSSRRQNACGSPGRPADMPRSLWKPDKLNALGFKLKQSLA
jgi:hypothetical protein